MWPSMRLTAAPTCPTSVPGSVSPSGTRTLSATSPRSSGSSATCETVSATRCSGRSARRTMKAAAKAARMRPARMTSTIAVVSAAAVALTEAIGRPTATVKPESPVTARNRYSPRLPPRSTVTGRAWLVAASTSASWASLVYRVPFSPGPGTITPTDWVPSEITVTVPGDCRSRFGSCVCPPAPNSGPGPMLSRPMLSAERSCWSNCPTSTLSSVTTLTVPIAVPSTASSATMPTTSRRRSVQRLRGRAVPGAGSAGIVTSGAAAGCVTPQP